MECRTSDGHSNEAQDSARPGAGQHWSSDLSRKKGDQSRLIWSHWGITVEALLGPTGLGGRG
jgi:hypothetical protein